MFITIAFKLLKWIFDFSYLRLAVPICDVLRADTDNILQGARFIGICFDGSTDSSVHEVEVIFFTSLENGDPVTHYCSLEDVKHAHAAGVFEAISNGFLQRGLPDWLQKVVGLSADGAKVNVGAHNSVATRIQAEIIF